MATTFTYARPDELVTYGAGVSSSSVNTSGGYVAGSLCGGWPAPPVRWSTANPSGTVTLLAAGTIGLVVVSHHKLVAGTTITFSSGITAVVTAPTVPPDGIPLNAFNTLTPVAAVTAFNFAVAGNTGDAIIGEILAGSARTLTLPLWSSDQRGMDDFTREIPISQAPMAPYDPGLSARAPWKGKFLLTQAQLDEVIAWFLAQRNGTRPSVIIPDASVNDAWVGFLQKPSWSPAGPRHFHVDLVFVEIPRSRW